MSDPTPETVETPAAEAPETLVTEAPAPETLVTETTAAEAPAAEDPFSSFGGREAVEAAHKMWEASRTEDGVTKLFVEAGQALGLGIKELSALFGTDPEPETPEADEPFLTAKDLAAAFEKQRADNEKRDHDAKVEAARAATLATLSELNLEPGSPVANLVCNLGDPHLKGDLSPEAVRAAVRAGHAEYEKLLVEQSQKYLTSKAATKAAVPKAPTGTAPAPTPPAEPRNVAEAIAAIRRMRT